MRIIHEIRWISSENYRQQCKLQRGEEIWKMLDDNLPPMTGTKGPDDIRLRLFIEKVRALSPEDVECLKMYLADRTNYWQHNFSEHTTATVEDIESKLTLKYESHWQALKKEGI